MKKGFARSEASSRTSGSSPYESFRSDSTGRTSNGSWPTYSPRVGVGTGLGELKFDERVSKTVDHGKSDVRDSR